MQPAHMKQYFGEGELLQSLTKFTDGNLERTGEDAFAKSLFSCESSQIARLLPEYFESIERLHRDTDAAQDPKPTHLQFSRGAPTWERLAWKCRTAYLDGGAEVIAHTAGKGLAEAFFAKYKDIIDAQEEKKLGYTKKVKELFPDNVFFTLICGKPFAPAPYATPKHLASNIFKIESDAEFSAAFDTYTSTLLRHRDETKLHPEIVEDLLTRLAAKAHEPKNAPKLALLSTAGNEMVKQLPTT